MHIIHLLILLAATTGPAPSTNSIEDLRTWLDKSQSFDQLAKQSFATTALSREDAGKARQMLWGAWTEREKARRQTEWDARRIKLGKLEMKFEFNVFGEKPADGRSLFLSMHGGGGAPARVNERQWKNQIGLYQPEEGVYLAPRAPTDTWNLWHQAHIDEFFQRIIEDAVLFADVNPDRVYLMGYSAGGDGVYQLAPRMADYLAAAAMMAGHPNDASPLGLRNIGFTLHMGGDDKAYKRNEVARQWKKMLAELQKQDPDGYRHEVVIHEGLGHWMQKRDAVAIPWMSRFKRQPLPNKIVWKQSGVTHSRYYWLAVDTENRRAGSEITIERNGQTFNVAKASGIDQITIRINDQMVDLDKPIKVTAQGKTLYEGQLPRTIANLAKCLQERGDLPLLFPAAITVKLQPSAAGQDVSKGQQ